MTWFPPLIKDENYEEFDSIAVVFEECDALEFEVAKLKDKLVVAEWALEMYTNLDKPNIASEALRKIRNG